MLLALDTSSAAVTVALHDGTSVVAEDDTVDPLRHAELLAPAIRRVLETTGVAAADVRRIAVGVGPGPFTGLRVGVVTARTMAAVLEVPLVGVCSLDVVAAGAGLPEPFAVATDARRREVYWAWYYSDGRRVGEPVVSAPALVATDAPVAGRGAALYPECFPRRAQPEYPSAADLAALIVAGRAELRPAEPLYLRRPDVAVPGPRKSVL
jgi:tRNA threonylcarbamoyl adenosine modification protein YeaZ